MKNLILFFVLLLSVTTLSLSQNEWTDLTYHYQTGTVPPPHYFSYDININSSGIGNLVYFPSYSKDSSWVYDINLSKSELKKLNKAIKKSKILTEEIAELPENKHPIGGSLQNIRIVLKQEPNLDQVPKSIITPYFPLDEQKDKLIKLYEVVKGSIKKQIWDEIDERKEKSKKE